MSHGGLDEKGERFGWDSIWSIPIKGGKSASIVTEYGLLDQTTVKDHVKKYHGTPSRLAQIDHQLGQTLLKSLSPEIKDRVRIEPDEYKLMGADGQKAVSGLALLMLIITKVSLDNTSTIFLLHARHMAFAGDILAKEFDYDIEAYHDELRKTSLGLKSRGQNPANEIPILFSGYAQVQNGPFKRMVERLQDDCTSGALQLSSAEIMVRTAAFYRKKVLEKTWNEKTKADAKLIALNAEIAGLKAAASGAPVFSLADSSRS